jgi:hypothetical protein
MSQEEIKLGCLSDDSNIKQYIQTELMPKVFHDIPMNVLNVGALSLINEYMSQALEQQSFTSTFYFNESFITKAILPDSIYSEAAIFNIGYAFATASSCQFLLELRIEDLRKNATLNASNGLMEFVLDKDTKFNLSNGSVYSLDYDILVQFKDYTIRNAAGEVVSKSGWNVQYTNMENATNSVATNKNPYILYRVTDIWLCLMVQANEYERESHLVVNNTTNNIPNEDAVFTCNNHIAGFDIKYNDPKTGAHYLPKDHILPIHSSVNDMEPYVHYIMDNPQTIRFIFQLNGNRRFVPSLNSSYEIIIYTCHGKAANFTAFKQDEQPLVITASNRYTNNANVTKAAFVISPSMGGVDIGTTDTVRRETIEAYNTANVISTDHDLDEYFKTFFFKNVLYPFFFKRRDDPWGRIWSGYVALKDTDDYIFRTNTLHANIPYEVLYNNNDNTMSSNEMIIPPGWIWTYGDASNRYTVMPYTQGDGKTVETAKTLANISEKFVFSNPFGIRIQKTPFAIGYFSPWVSTSVTTTNIPMIDRNVATDDALQDMSYVYHASPITTDIERTYAENYYHITTVISPTISSWIDGSDLVSYVRTNAVAPVFSNNMWIYFKKPLDLYAGLIPMLPLVAGNGYLSFDPEKTYFCVTNKNRLDNDTWALSDIWIEDQTAVDPKKVLLPITGEVSGLLGSDTLWGDNGKWRGHEVYASGDVSIGLYPTPTAAEPIVFSQVANQNYYELKLNQAAADGAIVKMVVSMVTDTTLTKYREETLVKIGKSWEPNIYINLYFANGLNRTFTITNAANVYTPYEYEQVGEGQYEFDLNNIGADGIILYADMKPAPDSGAVAYYRIPFSEVGEEESLFYVSNTLLPVEENNLRVVLQAYINGALTGYTEMQPVARESDGSYTFDTKMYPLNQLVDIDNRINIASTTNGGGSWISAVPGTVVNIDATHPELKMLILVRSSDETRDSDIRIGDSYTGFRLVDQYSIDDVSLVQELKEMRSVVNFGESSVPTEAQMALYKAMLSLNVYDESNGNMWTIVDYAYKRMNGVTPTMTFNQLKTIASTTKQALDEYLEEYVEIVQPTVPNEMVLICSKLMVIINDETTTGNDIDWEGVWTVLNVYDQSVNAAFVSVNVNGHLEVQLVPFVEYTLMNSERFPSFVSSATKVHYALEPVIMKRLEGNNYLDCKLIATYGLPHSYTADIDYGRDIDWPDLNVQIEFDVRLFNASLASNTIMELRTIIKNYFHRLTNIHTAADAVSMDNNIYISHIIQQMEEHPNVAYLRFVGWYTNDRNKPNGEFKGPDVQGIVQKWKSLDVFPQDELERFTPELFTLEDESIVLNII